MLPRWHIALGLLFSLVVYFYSQHISLFHFALIFLSSFLIDIDHYINSVYKNRTLSLSKALRYHDKILDEQKKEISLGIRKKGDFHFFHTLEFQALIGFFAIFYFSFFMIFIGLVFHSLLDVISMIPEGALHRREFFFSRWILNKF